MKEGLYIQKVFFLSVINWFSYLEASCLNHKDSQCQNKIKKRSLVQGKALLNGQKKNNHFPVF